MAIDMNDPEVKAAIKEAVDAAVEKEKEGLDSKNKELLAEVKDLKAKLRKTQDVNPDDLARLEAQVEDLQGKLDAATKTATAAARDLEKATKALETEQKFTQKLLVQDGLKSALIEAGVKDVDFIDTLTAKFSGSATIVTEGEDRKVVIGDKPLSDYIKEWAGSDSGKKFVAAPINGGGGAPGSGGQGSGAKTMPRSQFEQLDAADRATFMRDGGKLVDEAA